MLLAHALFKATLFLSVGIIDKSTGTRDLRELSGLAHKMPVVFTAAAIAAASMAGLPPMLGFIGQESVFAALLVVEIGRASCRESVCQYVSISVVAVSLKKKTHTKTK